MDISAIALIIIIILLVISAAALVTGIALITKARDKNVPIPFYAWILVAAGALGAIVIGVMIVITYRMPDDQPVSIAKGFPEVRGQQSAFEVRRPIASQQASCPRTPS